MIFLDSKYFFKSGQILKGMRFSKPLAKKRFNLMCNTLISDFIDDNLNDNLALSDDKWTLILVLLNWAESWKTHVVKIRWWTTRRGDEDVRWPKTKTIFQIKGLYFKSTDKPKTGHSWRKLQNFGFFLFREEPRIE